MRIGFLGRRRAVRAAGVSKYFRHPHSPPDRPFSIESRYVPIFGSHNRPTWPLCITHLCEQGLVAGLCARPNSRARIITAPLTRPAVILCFTSSAPSPAGGEGENWVACATLRGAVRYAKSIAPYRLHIHTFRCIEPLRFWKSCGSRNRCRPAGIGLCPVREAVLQLQ
jgi:hypothetical protein